MNRAILYKILIPLDNLVMSFYKVEYIGKENIPKEGSAILAGNHTAKLDPLLLMSSTKRNIHFLAKKELYKGIKKPFFKGVGIIPVDRSKKNPDAMKTAEEYLNNGRIIGIFPEGTINRTSDIIMPFKKGAVALASKTNSKIVPFSITGKYHLFHKSIKICFDKPYNVKNDILQENEKLENKIKELIRRNS